jgi:hypothetical protein
MATYDSDPKIQEAVKQMRKAGQAESNLVIKSIAIGVLIGLFFGYLTWNEPEKEPAFVEPVGDRVIYIIPQFGKPAFVFTRYKDSGTFKFDTVLRPESPYYPNPEKIISRP